MKVTVKHNNFFFRDLVYFTIFSANLAILGSTTV